jgi:transporter family-2 protein
LQECRFENIVHQEFVENYAMFFLLFAAAAGVALTLQLGVNNRLREGLENPILTALVSFAIGAVGIVAYLLLSLWNGSYAMPTARAASEIAWWKWLGGLLGAVYVVGVIIVVERLGGATTTGVVIAGQLISALVLDHFGVLGFPQHPISLLRVVGALLLILGVYLIQKF